MLDYQITKDHMLSRWSWLNDFEDRYHDVWEMFLRYPPPDTVNPLTAFKRMWSSWYTWTKERRREATAESIIEFLDPEDERYTNAASDGDGIPDNTLEVMIRRVLPQLSTQARAVGAMRLAGYTLSEIADELQVSPARISQLWDELVSALQQLNNPSIKVTSLRDKALARQRTEEYKKSIRERDRIRKRKKKLTS